MHIVDFSAKQGLIDGLLGKPITLSAAVKLNKLFALDAFLCETCSWAVISSSVLIC